MEIGKSEAQGLNFADTFYSQNRSSRKKRSRFLTLYILYIYYIYYSASALEKPGTWVRLPASVRFFIFYVASFLLCCPCEALEGPISTRVGII